MNKSKLLKVSALAFVLSLSAGLCSAFTETKVSANTPAPTSEIIGKNLSLDDNIYVLYAVDFQNTLETDETGVLVWTAPQETYDYQTANAVLYSTGTMTDDDGVTYPTFSYNKLSAKQMTEVIFASSYVERDGTYYYGEVEKYSILEYAYNKLGKTEKTETDDEDLKTLLTAMLNYGAAAQIYKDYNLDKLATDNYVHVRIENATFEDGFNYGLFETGDELKFTVNEGYELSENAPEYIREENGEYILTVPNEKLVLTDLVVEAKKYSQGLKYTYISSTDSYEVSGIGECTDTDIIIPDTYEGKPVTSIGKSAFSSCNSLTSITIPNSIRSIQRDAFYYCQSLTFATIPNSITSIGSSAFYGCDSLVKVNYKGSVGEWLNISGLSNLMKGSGANRKQLYFNNVLATNLVVPDTITKIQDYAFYHCVDIESITISNSITSIGTYALGNCIGLSDILIPDSVTSIGEYAFFGSGLTSVTIPDSITSIAKSTFWSCDKLTDVVIGNGVTTIGEQAFSMCENLTNITIRESVTSINEKAFYGCNNLSNVYIESVEKWCTLAFNYDFSNPLWYGASLYLNNQLVTELIIPNSVTEIYPSTFRNCTSLTHVTIPSSVKSIYYNAFYGCDNLTSATFENPNGWAADGTSLSATDLSNTETAATYLKSTYSSCYWKWTETEKYSEGLEYTYLEETDSYEVSWLGECTDEDVVIPTTYEGKPVTSIGDSAFIDAWEFLNSVTIGDSITSIGVCAFSDCYGLTNVIIGNSVKTIGNEAFYRCEVLESVTFGNAVEKIGDYAFSECYCLADAVLPASVTEIGVGAFESCGGLTSMVIPNSVKTIGNSTFISCTGLTNVTLPSLVESIGDSAFRSCTGLTNVTIPASVSFIGTQAFYNCSKLASIEVESENKAYASLSGNLYNKSCDTLISYAVGKTDTSFGVPNSVKTIGKQAFYGCKTLTSVTLGEDVETIGEYAFQNCTKLTSAVISDSVTSIEKSAFHGCSVLANVTMGNSVETIGNQAFYNCGKLTQITLPDTLTSLGSQAFYKCSLLSTILMPNSLTVLENGLFQLCSKLESVTIGSGVETIKADAFNTCSSLTSITIPASVTSIEQKAFYKCTKLAKFVVDNENQNYQAINGNLYTKGDVSLLQYAIGKTDTSFTVPSGVTSIGLYAFYGSTALTSITLGEDVKTIESYAFQSCTKLASITIDENVEKLGSYAFQGCTKLGEATINAVNIGNNVFNGCSILAKVTIGEAVTQIASNAFNNCSKLTSAVFENTDGWICSTMTLGVGGGLKEVEIASEDLADAAKAATYLKTTYKSYTWNRTVEA